MANILPPPPTDMNPASPAFRDWFYKIQQIIENLILVVINAFTALGTGIIVKTGTNTYAVRTITAGEFISVTNGDGVSGNPTVAISPDVLAFAAAHG